MGYTPYQLMLQLLQKQTILSQVAARITAPFQFDDYPKMIHQSSATGMQAIPTTGIAQGIQYIEHFSLKSYPTPPVVVCSFGDTA
jgi:2-oxoisovalerate dehydrogenase E1 component